MLDFFTRLGKIDCICAALPDAVSIRQQLPLLLAEPASRNYFFDLLGDGGDANWLEVLRQEGILQSSPHPTNGGEYVQFPPWHAGQYLVRMAGKAPELVRDIILEMQDIDNMYVVYDLVRAAREMPAKIAEPVAQKIKGLLDLPYGVVFPEAVGMLAAHLASGGCRNTALSLLNELLSISPSDDDSNVYAARARFSSWEYEQILVNQVPTIVEACGMPVLDLLCNLLDQAGVSAQKELDSLSVDSYSCLWCDAVEDDSSNQDGDLRRLLVSAIRDVAESVVRSDAEMLPLVICDLCGRKWSIFPRIAMHIVRVQDKPNKALVTEWIMKRDLFDNILYEHEYAVLLRDHFARLDVSDQATIINWIFESAKENGAEDKDSANWWCYQYLNLISSSITGDVLGEYERLRPKYLDASGLDTPHFRVVSGWVEHESPKGANELAEMSIDDLVHYLKTWKPEGDYISSRTSVRGLADALKQAVSTNPDHFADSALSFISVHPAYVMAFLEGLDQVVKSGNALNWQPVLHLGKQIITRPPEAPDCGRDVDGIDGNWGWARNSLIDLLKSGFKMNPGLPLELRKQAWNILEPLTHEPAPVSKSESRPLITAINSQLGNVMSAVVQYALWVRRELEKANGKSESSSFDDIPEARAVLEDHLNLEIDDSSAIRTIYGKWLPWLHLLDSAWTKDHLDDLFPSDPENMKLRNACWDTYVTYCHPYTAMLEPLKEQYCWAAANVGRPNRAEDREGEADGHLAQHLLQFYGWGLIDLSAEGNPLSLFFTHASDDLRGDAIRFIGNSLRGENDQIDEDLKNRLRAFWEWRMSIAQKADNPDNFKSELASFGWWFVSGCFDQDWAMNQLRMAIQLAGRTSLDREVVAKLAEITDAYPVEVVECLRNLLKGLPDRGSPDLWVNHAKTALAKAIEHRESREAAKAAANEFGSKGYIEGFRELACGS